MNKVVAVAVVLLFVLLALESRYSEALEARIAALEAAEWCTNDQVYELVYGVHDRITVELARLARALRRAGISEYDVELTPTMEAR